MPPGDVLALQEEASWTAWSRELAARAEGYAEAGTRALREGRLPSAEALLRNNAAPSEAEIRTALSGNLCRCTGYVKIIESVHAAAEGSGECGGRR